MNYYNPYFYSMPTNSITPKMGIFSSLFGKKITLSGFLNGTQRVLNFANQTIPLVKQVKPMIGNAKTMFKVMNEFKKTERVSKTNNHKNIVKSKEEQIESNEKIKSNNTYEYYDNGPTFFM